MANTGNDILSDPVEQGQHLGSLYLPIISEHDHVGKGSADIKSDSHKFAHFFIEPLKYLSIGSFLH